MNYDKGPHLTVGMLKTYLNCIPDDIKVMIGSGGDTSELNYLLNYDGKLLLHSDSYMEDATEVNLKTVFELQKNYEKRNGTANVQPL